MWDVHCVGSGDVVFEGFTPAAGVVAQVDSGGADPRLRANGGDPVHPNTPPGPEPIGVLSVSAPPGGTGQVQVTGNLWVSTLLAALPVDGSPGGEPLAGVEGPDSDGDGEPDATDVCPNAANALQETSVQDGLFGIGCACLCGDVNNSCTVTVSDVDAIQSEILPKLGAQAGCTDDDSGLCGSPPITEVRGCDASASGSCGVFDADVVQGAIGALITVGGQESFPLANGYDPANCAQSDPNPITPF